MQIRYPDKTILQTYFSSFIFTVLLIFNTIPAYSGTENGTLIDLRQWDGEGLINLNAAWDFYWQSFFTSDYDKPADKYPIRLPALGAWQNYTSGKEKLPSTGYGTYATSILLPENIEETFVLRMPGFHTPVRVYCNGKLIYSNGKPGETEAQSRISEYKPAIKPLYSDDGVILIVVQVSNFEMPIFREYPPLIIAGYDTAQNREFFLLFFEIVILTVLFAAMVYHISIGTILLPDKKFLLFGLFNLGPILFLLVNSNIILGRFGVPWAVTSKIHFASRIFSVYIFLIYTCSFFSVRPPAVLRKGVHFIFISLIALLASAPTRVQILFYYPSLALLLLVAVSSMTISIRGIIRKELYAIPFTLSVLFFIIASLRDVFGVKTPWAFLCCSYTVVGAVLFGIIQVFLLTALIKRHIDNVEDLVVQRTRKIEEMLWTQERSARMGEMMSFVAHQWQQYLYTISLYIDGLDKKGVAKPVEARVSEYVPVVRQTLTSMFTTLKNFREFLKPKIKREQFSAAEQTEKVLSLLEDLFSARGIKVNYSNNGDSTLWGIRNEFEQVVLNLLSNAANILKERTISQPWIYLSIKGAQTDITLSIEDNGGGISQEMRDKLFTAYQTTREEGSGMGLYMSRRIIQERFSGTLEVSSGSEGACFTITIPREPRKNPR